ncbi:MAG: lactate utilization protein [Halanaerobiales bacterium]
MSPKKQYYQNISTTLINNFKKRNIEGFYCDTKEKALNKALSYLSKDQLIGYGGSMTLNEIGLIKKIEEDPKYNVLSKNNAKTKEEKEKLYLDAFHSNVYFMSSNAITLDGQLVNIDGNGNRVAALIYGPKQVIIIAGMNKLVPSVDEAINRIQNFATPPNSNRLNLETPCTKTGKCEDCLSKDCICCEIVITRKSRHDGRIKVILVGENLGY